MKIYTLPQLDFLKLRFHLLALQDCTLPVWKGSLLRGAFGHALRKTVCTMKRGLRCEDCMLNSQCAYTHLFETYVSKPPQFPNVAQSSPRPFVFEPHDQAQIYNSGAILWFDLILIGEAAKFLPYIVFAIFQMGEQGLGAQRFPFYLDHVYCLQQNGGQDLNRKSKDFSEPETPKNYCWQELYEGDSQRLLFNPETLSITEATNTLTASNSLTLKFLTNTRLVFKKQLSTDFTFRMLTFKMLRRVLELAYFYMPGNNIDWEFHDLLVAADEVEITHRNLIWHDQTRYSNRHKMKMKMGGFVGDLDLSGDLDPFLELLSYCEMLHVGKGATFGLGRVEVA